MCTVLLPPGVNLIAVNKYVNININKVFNLLSPRKYTVLNGNFVFDLRDFDLSEVFQDTNPGVKRDLTVRTAFFWVVTHRVVVISY
jgi:hypothetical protein